MCYNLLMSPAQIALCTQALAAVPGTQPLSLTRMQRGWGTQDVVVLDEPHVRELVACLEDYPQDDQDDADLVNLVETLLLVLQEPCNPQMLYGVCV